jgi:hypothetical protein
MVAAGAIHINEPKISKQVGHSRSKREIYAAGREYQTQCFKKAGKKTLIRISCNYAVAEVRLFAYQPAARADAAHQADKHFLAAGHIRKHRSMVNEIKLLITELPVGCVQGTHLDVPRHVHEKPAIYIRRNYRS